MVPRECNYIASVQKRKIRTGGQGQNPTSSSVPRKHLPFGRKALISFYLTKINQKKEEDRLWYSMGINRKRLANREGLRARHSGREVKWHGAEQGADTT